MPDIEPRVSHTLSHLVISKWDNKITTYPFPKRKKFVTVTLDLSAPRQKFIRLWHGLPESKTKKVLIKKKECKLKKKINPSKSPNKVILICKHVVYIFGFSPEYW